MNRTRWNTLMGLAAEEAEPFLVAEEARRSPHRAPLPPSRAGPAECRSVVADALSYRYPAGAGGAPGASRPLVLRGSVSTLSRREGRYDFAMPWSPRYSHSSSRVIGGVVVGDHPTGQFAAVVGRVAGPRPGWPSSADSTSFPTAGGKEHGVGVPSPRTPFSGWRPRSTATIRRRRWRARRLRVLQARRRQRSRLRQSPRHCD